MLRTPLVLSLALSLGALTFARAGDFTPAGPCPDFLKRQPLVVVDVSGSTLLGPYHEHLAVYEDGLSSISRAGGLPGEPESQAAFQVLEAAAARQLHQALIAAGAGVQCDDDVLVTDVPLTTITILSGGTEAQAHSFSYWIPTSPRLEGIQLVVDEFIGEHFPEF